MAEIDLSHNIPDVLDVLHAMQERMGDLSEPMSAIAAMLESASERAFADEANPTTGEKWDPLSPVTLQLRPHRADGQILQDSGQLAASIETDFGPDYAAIGTNKIYAGTMFFGAQQGAFGKSAKGNPLPWGDIPAREFIGLNEDDQRDILDILAEEMLAWRKTAWKGL